MTRKNRLKAKVLPFTKHMAAIADVSRMSVLFILAHGPQDVREIMAITGLSPALLSHHMSVLLKEGWVRKSKFGKRVEYVMETKAFFVLERLFKDTMVGKEIFPSK